ncbi:MAG: arsenate reductase ArsC [Bacteroidota bacterium]
MIEKEKPRVLFLCVANSCRSQMAEGIVRNMMGDEVDAYSAGAQPTTVNNFALEVLEEKGFDVSLHRSKSVEEFRGHEFDLIVTVCGEGEYSCPAWLDKGKKIHVPYPDPAAATGTREEVLNVFRGVRDSMIKKLLVEVVKNLKAVGAMK